MNLKQLQFGAWNTYISKCRLYILLLWKHKPLMSSTNQLSYVKLKIDLFGNDHLQRYPGEQDVDVE